MPDYAFAYGEATLNVTAVGSNQQELAYATRLSISKTPTLLEDASRVFSRVRINVDSVWVADSLLSITQSTGPFAIVITWQNADDLRLRSEALQNASLTQIDNQGDLSGVQIYSLTFEGFER